MTYETIEFDVAGGVATITLNRPDNANALCGKMAEEMFDASIICQTDPAVRAVLVTARGKLFCAGGDLAEMDAAGDGRPAHLVKMATLLHQALIRFSQMDAPVVMGVNGTAGGGGFSVALSGDYVIASDRAKFVSAYTSSALTPDGSSTYFLAKHVGLLRAKELMLTNRVLSAEEALDWGIVNRVVPNDDLPDAAREMAARFAKGPTRAFGGVKRLLATAYSEGMEGQLDKEAMSIAGMMGTHDAVHGLQSFLRKEKPTFKGK